MGLILFIDTETTGKLNFRAAPDHPSQPHIVQFAAITSDEAGKVVGQYTGLVQPPPDFEIPAEATAIHGITTEEARQCGISPITALHLLDDLAMPVKTIVAHNVDFDCGVIGCMYARDRRVMNMYGGGLMTPAHFCTMKASTDICRLPGKYGFKWPKLIEAHQHFFGCGFDGEHDALADVRVCMKIYFELKNRGVAAAVTSEGGAR